MNFTVTVDLTGPELVADAFLLVSCVALVVQVWSFHRIHLLKARAGLYRTAVCRVVCAVVYVLVGVNAIWGQWIPLTVSFAAFTATQLTWMVNARLDVRQSRKVTISGLRTATDPRPIRTDPEAHPAGAARRGDRGCPAQLWIPPRPQ